MVLWITHSEIESKCATELNESLHNRGLWSSLNQPPCDGEFDALDYLRSVHALRTERKSLALSCTNSCTNEERAFISASGCSEEEFTKDKRLQHLCKTVTAVSDEAVKKVVKKANGERTFIRASGCSEEEFTKDKWLQNLYKTVTAVFDEIVKKAEEEERNLVHGENLAAKCTFQSRPV